jgi:hypothetical protein
MLELLHRYRKPFVFLNALGIVVFGLGAAALGERFWAFFGYAVAATPLLRLCGWYLAVHGVAGLLVAKAPERQPAVLVAIGVEKLGAVACFAALELQGPTSALLGLIAGFDAVMAAVFLAYARWLVHSGLRDHAP